MQFNQIERSDGYVNISEAAELAGVSRQTVHNWIAYGRVQPLSSDDGYLLDVGELSRFLAVRQVSSEVGVKVDTLRHWMDDADELSAP